jgi:hypothetical protein
LSGFIKKILSSEDIFLTLLNVLRINGIQYKQNSDPLLKKGEPENLKGLMHALIT